MVDGSGEVGCTPAGVISFPIEDGAGRPVCGNGVGVAADKVVLCVRKKLPSYIGHRRLT